YGLLRSPTRRSSDLVGTGLDIEKAPAPISGAGASPLGATLANSDGQGRSRRSITTGDTLPATSYPPDSRRVLRRPQLGLSVRRRSDRCCKRARPGAPHVGVPGLLRGHCLSVLPPSSRGTDRRVASASRSTAASASRCCAFSCSLRSWAAYVSSALGRITDPAGVTAARTATAIGNRWPPVIPVNSTAPARAIPANSGTSARDSRRYWCISARQWPSGLSSG